MTQTPPPLAPEYIPALLGAFKASQLLPACLAPAVVPALVARYVVAPWIPRRRILDVISGAAGTKGPGMRSRPGRSAASPSPSQVGVGPANIASRIVSTAMTSLSTSVLAKLCAEGDTAMGSKVVALSASLPNVRRIVADKHGLPDSLGPVLRAWGAIEEVAVTTDSCTRSIDMLPAALVSLNVSSVTPLKNLFAPAKGNRGGPVPRWCTPTDAFRFSGLSLGNLTHLRLPMATRADLAGLVSLRSLRLERPFYDHDGVLRLLGGAPLVTDGGKAPQVVSSDDSDDDRPGRTKGPASADPLPFAEHLTALCVVFEETEKRLSLPVLPRLQRLGVGVFDPLGRPRLAALLRAFPGLEFVSASLDRRGFSATYDTTEVPAGGPVPALIHKLYRDEHRHDVEWQEVLDYLSTRPGLTAPTIDLDTRRALLHRSGGAARVNATDPTPQEAERALHRYATYPSVPFFPWLKDSTDTVAH